MPGKASGSLNQQIQDAFVSGTLARRQQQQQDAANKAAQQASASAAAYSASIDDDNTATAVVQSLPQLIVSAMAGGHTFIPLLEIKGHFDPHKPFPGKVQKIIDKLTGTGLKVTVIGHVGAISESLHLGIRL